MIVNRWNVKTSQVMLVLFSEFWNCIRIDAFIMNDILTHFHCYSHFWLWGKINGVNSCLLPQLVLDLNDLLKEWIYIYTEDGVIWYIYFWFVFEIVSCYFVTGHILHTVHKFFYLHTYDTGIEIIKEVIEKDIYLYIYISIYIYIYIYKVGQ